MKTLIYGGTVVDPASHTNEKKNLLIEDGKILRTEKPQAELPQADRVIDASGKIVCPGFIDIHMHEDPVGEDGTIFLDEEKSIFCCMLRMGVTTAIGGNCGSNVYDPVAYLNLAEQEGMPVNVGLMAGHNYFRKQVGCTVKYASATFEQMLAAAWRVRQALDGGCIGVSYGIRYDPGMDLWEMMGTAKACAEAGKLVSAHIRDDGEKVFGAAEEFMELGRTLHVPLEISHIGSMAGFGQMERFLKLTDQWREEGTDVSCDCYPYDAFCTGIGETTYDEGWMERYKCDYSVIEACEGKYKGRRLTKESFEELRKDHPEYLTVCHVMNSSDIELALRHPRVMLGSDGILNGGQGHPRAAGAFPRLISSYVKTGSLTLEQAVAKMTVMPADRLKLKNKGRLSAGADGDVVVFDYDKIKDNSSFEHPLTPPSGIEWVLIGGEPAVREGQIVSGRLGRTVRN